MGGEGSGLNYSRTGYGMRSSDESVEPQVWVFRDGTFSCIAENFDVWKLLKEVKNGRDSDVSEFSKDKLFIKKLSVRLHLQFPDQSNYPFDGTVSN